MEWEKRIRIQDWMGEKDQDGDENQHGLGDVKQAGMGK
jgi:hypothetical protein